jgi:hypothetical protein
VEECRRKGRREGRGEGEERVRGGGNILREASREAGPEDNLPINDPNLNFKAFDSPVQIKKIRKIQTTGIFSRSSKKSGTNLNY